MPPLLTRHDVLFSWALAEAYSPRWQGVMREGLSPALQEKLAAGHTQLNDQEQRELVDRLLIHREHKIKGYIDPFSQFRLISVNAGALDKIAVSPQAGQRDYPVLLGDYMAGKYDVATDYDPRNAAKHLLENPQAAPYTGYPVLSYSTRIQSEILIEGYTRCIAAILRHRRGEAVAPIAMIQCMRW